MKQESPIQIEYSVYNGTFILSIQFKPESTALKQLLSLVIKSVYGVGTDYLKLKELDPAFCEKHSKE